MEKKSIRYAFRSSIPVMAGYIVLGIGFGILLHSKGYGLFYCLLMSLFIYAGSMQFVAIDLITSGASLITTAIMTIMVNIRHLFYGISMLNVYQNFKSHKIYSIFALTDETFSLVCNDVPNEIDRNKYSFYVSLFDQCYWVTGSVIGNLLGNIIPFSTEGIDFSMTALFFIIVISQWESTKNHLPAITAFVISVGCLLIFGSDNFLIPTMILITIALFAEKKMMEVDD